MPRAFYKVTPTAAEKFAETPPTSPPKLSAKRLKAVDQLPLSDKLMPPTKSSVSLKQNIGRSPKAEATRWSATAALGPEPQSSTLPPVEIAAENPIEADQLASLKTLGRKDEASRQQLMGRIEAKFPPPSTFSAAEILKTLPELGAYQSAYAFLQTARRRGLIEKAERGTFRLTASVRETQPAQERAVATAPGPKPASVAVPSPPRSPATAPVPAPEPVAPAAGQRNEQTEIATLLQLSRRYRSDKYFRLDDIVVPLRECRSEIYGKAEVGAGDPPLCVVVGAYEPDLRVLNPHDIDVLFLDVHGQAHLRSAASWQFVPYRRKQG